MKITRMYQKNLTKHPIHPVIPSPKNEPINPNACMPQPISPSTTKAIIRMSIMPSIVNMYGYLEWGICEAIYFFVMIPLCERIYIPVEVLIMMSLPLVVISNICAPLHPPTKLQLLLPIVALCSSVGLFGLIRYMKLPSFTVVAIILYRFASVINLFDITCCLRHKKGANYYIPCLKVLDYPYTKE